MTAVIGLSGLLGVAIGSFLNVVIYRVPRGRSVVSPPSACASCGVAIRPYDNIPLISWLVLRGRCRDCKAPISVRYPIIELITGVVFTAVSIRPAIALAEAGSVADVVAAVLVLLAFLYLAAIGVALAAIDFDTSTLPNVIVLPAYLVGVALFGVHAVIVGDATGLLRGLVGGGALLISYFVIALIRPGGMGMGDVKLAGVLGLYLGWLGWGSLAVGSFAGFLLGGIVGVVLLATGRAKRGSGIPFGPWMLLGAAVGILFGENLWAGYLALVGLE